MTTQTTQTTQTTYKFSELLRIGARKRPQATGEYYSDGATCAFGAIYDGIPGKDVARDIERIREDENVIYSAIRGATGYCLTNLARVTPPPEIVDLRNKGQFYLHDDGTCSVDSAVMVLNDRCGWSREHIADWLEGEGL